MGNDTAVELVGPAKSKERNDRCRVVSYVRGQDRTRRENVLLYLILRSTLLGWIGRFSWYMCAVGPAKYMQGSFYDNSLPLQYGCFFRLMCCY